MRAFVFLIALATSVLIGCNWEPEEKNVEATDTVVTDPAMLRLDSLTKLLEASPNDHSLLNERAKVFLEVGETNFALADVGRSILLDSTVSDYFLTISDVYFRLGKPTMCLNALTKANQLQPESTEPLYRLAQFNLYLSKHQESIDFANRMLKLDPRDDRPFVIKALAHKQLGDTAKAIHNYLQAITENPDNFDAYIELGVLHFGKKDQLAEKYFLAALSIRPDDVLALYDLGLFYQENDKLNEALETYVRLLKVDSAYSHAYYNMGYIQYQHLQLYNEALVNFEKAVKADPRYYQAIYMRGLCYEAKGDVTAAKREYAYSLEINPQYKNAADGMQRLLSKKLK
jgi:tetratricopeptide (TPR) repeat protein